MSNKEDEQSQQNLQNQHPVLDVFMDKAFNKIALLATQFVDASLSIISLKNQTKIWFHSVDNLDIKEVLEEKKYYESIFPTEFDKNIIETPFISEHTSTDEKRGRCSYIFIPLINKKQNVGTFCIINTKPNYLTNKEKNLLLTLLDLIIEQINIDLSTKQIVQSKEKMLSIFKSIYDSGGGAKSFIDKNLNIVYTNQIAKKMCLNIFGKEPKSGDSALNFIPTERKEYFEDAYQRVLTGTIIQTENIQQGIWWKSSIQPIYDKNKEIIGLSHSVENITKHKNTEKQAKELQDNLDILSQNFPDGSISLIDKKMNVLYTGGQGYKKFGIEPKNFFSKHLSEMILPRLYNKLKEVVPKVWQGLSVSYEVNHKERLFLAQASPITNENNKIDAFVLTVVDITDQKQRENKIKKQNERLKNIAFQQSHKVRRPVATILGLMNLINMEKEQETIHLYLGHLRHEVETLDIIIRKIVKMTNQE